LRNQACQAQLERIIFTSIARTQSTASCVPFRTTLGETNLLKPSYQLCTPIDLRYLPISREFSTTNCNAKDKDQKAPEKIGIIKKFKKMMKDYWYVLIPVHVSTSIVWFGGFYIMLKSGVDIVGMLEYIGTSQKILDYLSNSEAGYYALSYACYKIATPARYTVTVGGTTLAISKLKDTGYLKSTSEVAEKIKDKRDDMKEKYKYDERKELVEDKIDDFKEKAVEKKDKLIEEVEDAWEKFAKKKK